MWVDNAVIVLYLAVVLGVGVWAGRGIRSIENYSVASRSFGPWVIFATLSASFIGGGFSLGNAEKVFVLGVANIVALWGFSLKEILVAKFVAPKMRNFPNAISVGDILEEDYGKAGKIIAGIFSTSLCLGILSAQVLAIGYVFNLFLGVSQTTGALLGCAIVIFYSTVGGMMAVVKTDIIQFVVLGIGLPLTLVFGYFKAGGFNEIVSSIPVTHLQIPAEGFSWFAFISIFFSFILGETLVPPYVQRLCIGRNSKVIEKGTLMAGLFSIPFFAVTGLLGLVALSMKPDLNPNLAIPYVVRESLPVFLRGWVIAGIISIAMSSADSFLNSASVAIVNDIISPLSKTKLTPRKELVYVKLATALCGIGAVVLALSFDSVLGLLMYAYDFWAPIILPVLTLAIMVVWNQIYKQPYKINALPIAVFANIVVMFVAEKLTAKPERVYAEVVSESEESRVLEYSNSI